MVNIEEISEPPAEPAAAPAAPIMEESPSASRQADAAELAALLPNIKRPTLKTQLMQLQTKLEKDAKALQRVEASKAQAEAEAAPQAAEPAVAKPAAVPIAKPVAVSVPSTTGQKYIPISTFSFDAGSYGSKTVSIYISLPGVGSIDKSNISCPFTSTSFDLSIHDLKGKNYRLVKDNLEHEIDAEKSKLLIKSDRIVIKLAKVKGEYGSYDSWSDLTSKKGKSAADKKKKTTDPSASIMELMKDMYDSGDDNMKKMIGETMLKQREGRLNDKDGMDDFKPPGGL